MKTAERKPKKRTADPSAARWKPILSTIAKTVAVGVLLILAASLGVSFTSDPDRYIRPIAIVCAALTFFSGGFFAAKSNSEAPLGAGAINGLILSALTLALSLLFRKTAVGYPAWAAALLHGGMILLSLLGAYLTVLRGKRAKPRKRRKKHT